jgi:hypothetical protein
MNGFVKVAHSLNIFVSAVFSLHVLSAPDKHSYTLKNLELLPSYITAIFSATNWLTLLLWFIFSLGLSVYLMKKFGKTVPPKYLNILGILVCIFNLHLLPVTFMVFIALLFFFVTSVVISTAI